jgi:hypothetical protein
VPGRREGCQPPRSRRSCPSAPSRKMARALLMRPRGGLTGAELLQGLSASLGEIPGVRAIGPRRPGRKLGRCRARQAPRGTRGDSRRHR